MDESKRVLIISRCSWTLYKFRLPLMLFLKKNGYQVFSAGYELHSASKLLEDAGIVHFDLGPLEGSEPTFVSQFIYARELKKVFDAVQPKIVHLFTMQPVLIGSIVARVHGVKPYITVTGLGHIFLKNSAKPSILIRSLFQNATRFARGCIFQNKDDEKYLIERGCINSSIRSYVVAGSGVDVDKFKPSRITGYSEVATMQIKFVMISRLIREKGIIEFCEASKLLNEKYGERIQISVVGEIDKNNPTSLSEEEVQTIVVDSGILLIPHQSEVVNILQESHVVVLPSYREGLSMALLEGCAVGLAAVTTNVTGCRDIVKDGLNGTLVEPKDSVALFNAMEAYILKPSLIIDHGANSRELMINNFSSIKVFEEIVKIYIEGQK